jgi:hypothetical protein
MFLQIRIIDRYYANMISGIESKIFLFCYFQDF